MNIFIIELIGFLFVTIVSGIAEATLAEVIVLLFGFIAALSLLIWLILTLTYHEDDEN